MLVVDEVGYLAFDHRNADLLFQVVSRRYEKKSLVLTTNLAFNHWPSVFPNATCATALMHRDRALRTRQSLLARLHPARPGLKKGIEKGVERMLRDLFARRLHRALTAREQEALAARAAIDPEQSQDKALALEGEALAA